MEKIIEVDITNEDDLFEKYNKKIVSRNLINYILESTPQFNKKDNIKIIINNKINDKTYKSIILNGFNKEYEDCMIKHNRYNKMQLVYLLVGIISLFISTLIERTVFKEIVLIGGWVLIWTMIELEMSSEFENRRKRRILKKLLNSEIVEVENK